MSYDIRMVDPETGETIKSDEPNQPQFRSCVVAVGQKFYDFQIVITYNYSRFYYETIDDKKSLRWIYGKTGKEVYPVLEKAIAILGTQADPDYYRATAGNAGSALLALAYFAKKRPDGIFKGD